MPSSPRPSPLAAYVAPFGVFIAFLGLDAVVSWLGAGSGVWWLATPKYWIFPLQTAVCALVLLIYGRQIKLDPWKPWPWGILAGVVALGLWISPQALFHAAPRVDGFNPEVFGSEGPLYVLNVVARFTRLVIVIPLVEEIFWRGFLLRYLVREDFQNVAFGTFRPLAFFGVALLFMLEHSSADYIAAFLTGVIYNLVAVRTKSLFACVVAHAVTNAGLGAYIMATRQWGFW
jgi:uncharacterized protein